MSRTLERFAALAEVGLVFGCFFVVKHLARASGFNEWQVEVFGHRSVTASLAFFVLPLPWMVWKAPSNLLSTRQLGPQMRIAAQAMACICPFGALFPVLALLGTTYQEWLGSALLSLGYGIGVALFFLTSRGLPSLSAAPPGRQGLLGMALLLILGLAVSYLLQPFLPIAVRVIRVVVFVALLEEFLFRGYVQSRINTTFGRPFEKGGVRFGWGLLVGAGLFGLAHPLSVPDGTMWAWGIWTAVGGLGLGYLREKTEGLIAPAALHALMILPTAFLAPA